MSDTQDGSAVTQRDGQNTRQSPNPPRIRRRNRIITSCLECRRRKLKCDRSHPCNHCSKSSRDCVFLAPALDSASKGKLNQFKERLDSLEKGLGESGDARSLYISNSNAAESSAAAKALQEDANIPEDERHLEPTPLAVTDIAYEDEADDFADDLGVKFGKMKIHERIGGFVRPRLSEEIAESFRTLGDLETFYESAENSILNTGYLSDIAVRTQTYIEPAVDALSPSNALLFPNTSSDDVSTLSYIPNHDTADALLSHYWLAIHPIARCLHRPSFEQRYARFWQDVVSGYEPSYSLQAVVFAVLLAGAYAVPNDDVLRQYNLTRAELIPLLKAGCEHALAKSNVLRTTRLETLQAFVIYLITLCRDDVTRSHAALTSVAIRIAECAGMHRDGTLYGLSATETHVRRLVWYQLCSLDIRTCEAVGPRPQIRREDFDTKLPLNVDDADLDSLIPPRHDFNRWTEMTLAKINIECVEMSRAIWLARTRVEKRQTSLAAVLRMIEEHRQEMQKKYLPLIKSNADPAQALALRVFRLQISKMYIMLLHRYAVSAPKALPDRLKALVLASSITVLEEAMELETRPEFTPWSWLGRFLQQYHTALILMFEIYQNPRQREAERIWSLLAYTFDIPLYVSLREKIRIVIETLLDRLYEYEKARKQRLPTSIEQSLGPAAKSKYSTWAQDISEKLDDIEKRRHTKSASPPSLTMNNPQSTPSGGMSIGQRDPQASQQHQHSQQQYSNKPKVKPFLQAGFPFADWGDQPIPNIEAGQLGAHHDPSLAKSPQNVSMAGQMPTTATASPESVSTGVPNSIFNNEPGFDSMDWDELERLFPSDGTPGSQAAADWTVGMGSDGMDFSLPAFNLFPTGSGRNP